MNDLKARSEFNCEDLNLYEKRQISFSFSDVKRSIPRINFKKIKLNKFQSLYSEFKKVTITFLDDNLLKINLPVRKSVSEEVYDAKFVSPLRRKIESEEEKLPFIKEESKDVTFNMEAQVIHDEENVIFSPSQVSLPPLKEDVLSSSGEQSVFVWPPPEQKEQRSKKQEARSKKKQKSNLKKKKPYFVKEEKEKEAQETSFVIKSQVFPWVVQNEPDEEIEMLFQGGLESALLDMPQDFSQTKPEKLKDEPYKESTLQNESDKQQVIFKAIQSQGLFSEEISNVIDFKNIKFSSPYKAGKLRYSVELLGKVKKIMGKFGSTKITPIRIIIYGGFIVTLGYLLWTYYVPDLRMKYLADLKDDRSVVKDLFKKKHVYKKFLDLGEKDKKEKINISKPFIKSEEGIFKPISEQERLALIQRAREALESRLDPFGQEDVLPRKVREEKMKEKEEKGLKEIEFERKQIELVGVISSKTSDLALVNLYTANYAVSEDDVKETRESKLKSALSMAVPNRIEISVLDPIEGWVVKQIQKSKSRNEDPMIELVKGDKKFKLKVGQKVLLPEEKEVEEEEVEKEGAT